MHHHSTTTRGHPPLITRLASLLLAGIVALTSTIAWADMQGIDVSGWQPSDITCTTDYDFAVVKVSQGTTFENSSWRAQAKCVIDRGKKLGLYHYASGADPEREADYFLQLVGDYVGRATLNLDWESYQNGAWGQSDWIRRFVTRIHERTQVWPLVYVQASALNQVPSDVRRTCGLWVAQYASNAQTTYQATPWNYAIYGEAMRQYSSNGRLNGYSGALDLNYFRGDGGAWDAYANPAGKAQTAVKPSTPGSSGTTTPAQSLDSLVAATLRGDYGNLPERRERLGVDYERVQAEINRRMNGGATTSQQTTAQTTTRVTVRSGDTLSAIASRTGLWPLSAWSVPSGDRNRIYPGQTVVYTGSATVQAPAATGHVVRTGESLWSIYGTGWSAAAARNGIAAPYVIYPGQVLR